MIFSHIIGITVLAGIFGSFPEGATSVEYTGQYDVPGKDMYYLCTLMDDYVKTGVQPKVEDDVPAFDKNLYTKDNKCWRMGWYPCVEFKPEDSRPCGWYKMEDSAASDCL